MISKELLGEIFGWEVKFVNPRVNDKEISFIDYHGNTDSFNVYYIVHKCKEYIRKLGYQIKITYVEYNGNIFVELVDWRSGGAKIIDGCFKADNEFDAVVEAAQWVLENR